MVGIPTRFHPTIARIRALEGYDRYEGAFIFGSVARGDSRHNSDIDIQVVTYEKNSKADVIHTKLDGNDVDLSFLSREQLRARSLEEVGSNRWPMIGQSIVLFDKGGRIQELKAIIVEQSRLRHLRGADNQSLREQVLYADEKVLGLPEDDNEGVLLAMHLSLSEVLKAHVAANMRWWPGGKNTIASIRSWDVAAANLLSGLLFATELHDKRQKWSELVGYVLEGLDRGNQTQGKKVPRRSTLSEKGLRDVLRAGAENGNTNLLTHVS